MLRKIELTTIWHVCRGHFWPFAAPSYTSCFQAKEGVQKDLEAMKEEVALKTRVLEECNKELETKNQSSSDLEVSTEFLPCFSAPPLYVFRHDAI